MRKLSNNLGNVLSVISDIKTPVASGTVVSYYESVVISSQDYSPFGVTLEGRSWSEGYRYGFNGKEKDPEGMGGGGNTYDYGFRIYNGILGRFLSVDPLHKNFVWNSCYAYAENDVISCIDLDGCEKVAISGACPTNQYFKEVNGERANGTTHYNRENVNTFFAQTTRLKELYGYTSYKVYTGAEIISKLMLETQKHGELTSVAIFMHGGTSGLYLSNNSGLYSTEENQKNSKGSASMVDLQYRMKMGEIKFAPDAICFFDACNSAGTGASIYSETPAYEFTLLTGVTSIGCTGNVEMANPKDPNGKFKSPNGDFYILKLESFQKTVKEPNPDQSWFEFWKPDQIEKVTTVKAVTVKKIGNEVNIDDDVKK